MEDKRAAVADSLGRWAAQEMKYVPQGKYAKTAPPSANDMKLLCRGASIPMWDYIVHRVKSERTVSHVKQNLEVAKNKREVQSEALKKAERLAKLKERKAALQGQIAATREVIGNIHTQSRRSHLDLASSDRELDELKRRIEENDVKVVLLETFEKQLLRMHNLLNEYHARLASRLMHLTATQTSNEKTAQSEQDEKNEDPILQEVYDAIRAHLESHTSTTRVGQHYFSDLAMRALPADIQDKISEICSRPAAVSQLLSRLAEMTLSETTHLESETEKLDLKAMEAMALERLEMESLGQASQTEQYGLHVSESTSPRHFSKYPAGSTSPRAKKSSGGATFPTVEELLEIQRQEHVARYLASEKFLNSAHSLQKQRDQMLETTGRTESFFRGIDEISCKDAENSDANSPSAYGSASLPGSKTTLLQHRLQNMELAFCADEAAYEASCTIIERLSETKRRFERDLRTLKDKFQRIQELDGENKDRQLLCYELLRINGGTKEMFNAQTEALRTFSSKLVERQREIQAVKHDSDDQSLNSAMMNHEVSLFHQYTMISASESEKELMSFLAPIIEALELKAHQSMNGLVSSVANGLLNMEKLSNEHRNRKAELTAAVASFAQWNGEAAIKGLEEQVSQLEKTQTEVWMPILESSLTQVTKATDHCAAIIQLCSDFVKQPAQHFVPWLKLNGQTLEETTKSWKSVCHQLRPQR